MFVYNFITLMGSAVGGVLTLCASWGAGYAGMVFGLDYYKVNLGSIFLNSESIIFLVVFFLILNKVYLIS